MFMLLNIVLIVIILIELYYLCKTYGVMYPMNNITEEMTQSANYTVKFTTQWGADKEINHPPNPHTGNMFLVNHDKNFKLFELGQLASIGISNTAMYGTIDDLMNLTKNNASIGNVETSNVLMAPGETTLKINVTDDKPILSFSTMIAPSSDWFTGFSINLLDNNNNEWIKHKVIPLYVYIAGTDSNQGFVTEHKLRTVPEVISVKKDNFLYPTGKIKPIAYAIISKK